MPAAAIKTVFRLGAFGLALLVLANPHPAPAAQAEPAAAAKAEEEPPKSPPRTYDVYDILWYSEDGSDEGIPGDDTRKARSDAVVNLFKETIAPDSWVGPDAANTIEERDGRLIVTADESVHAFVVDILRQLRETSLVQGVSLDCHFILADEAFLKRHAPGALSRREPDGSVRGISPLKARQIVEAARGVPGVVVIPAPPIPLYSLRTSVLLGEERRIVLPRLATAGGPADAGAPVEVSRPVGMGLAVEAVADQRHVTLDLMVRCGSLEAVGGADGKPGGFDEVEARLHDAFAMERSSAFVARAPLVRAKLAVREAEPGPAANGAGEGASARPAGREVVRETSAEQSDPPRSLLVVGTLRPMSVGELTLLAGPVVAKRVSERFVETPRNPPPPPPAPPGLVPPPPPAPPPEPIRGISRAYNIRGLLLGPERGLGRAAARAKRLEHVMARVKEAVPDQGKEVNVRETYGHLIVTGQPHHADKVGAVIKELTAERLIDPE